MDAASSPRKRKKAAAAARKRRGGDARGRDLSPAAPPADAGGGRDAALVECAAVCCVLCACLPVAVLCCVARAPLRVARRCWRWRRRRPPWRLAPGGSSSFSDAELGDFRPRRPRRTMADNGGSGVPATGEVSKRRPAFPAAGDTAGAATTPS